jgi:hypothetical protein
MMRARIRYALSRALPLALLCAAAATAALYLLRGSP